MSHIKLKQKHLLVLGKHFLRFLDKTAHFKEASKRMRKQSVAFSSIILLLVCFAGSSGGSLLPYVMDHPGSLLSDLLTDRLADPFRVLEQIPVGVDRDAALAFSPARVDWKETPEGHVIMLDVPGLKKEELRIEVDQDRVLRVSGERKREEEKKDDHWHRVERSYGKFMRQFRLPDNVDLDNVSAGIENGVLTLKISKLSPDKIQGPRVVKIAGGDEKPAELKAGKQEL